MKTGVVFRRLPFLVFGYLNALQTAEGKASSILPAFALPVAARSVIA
jgi:hypothetical protein